MPTILLQVHIGTSSNASPENVSVFVGSDLTNSVTAPCACNPGKQVVHTRTPLFGVAFLGSCVEKSASSWW